jgi:hypothetical protein
MVGPDAGAQFGYSKVPQGLAPYDEPRLNQKLLEQPGFFERSAEAYDQGHKEGNGF